MTLSLLPVLISCDCSEDSAHQIVTILDENDNIPMFANLFYNATVVEEQDIGITQAMVVSDTHVTVKQTYVHGVQTS